MLSMILVRARAGLLGAGVPAAVRPLWSRHRQPVPPHRKEDPQAPALAQAPPRRWRPRRLAGAGRFGGSAPAQLLRYIRWRRGGARYEVLTNALAPTRLAAEEALALYPYWRIAVLATHSASDTLVL